MIIAIATNDRKTIAKRTGRAAEFAFFHITGNEITGVTYEKNRHEHHDHDRREGKHRQGGHGVGRRHQHHHLHPEHSHDEVVEQLKNVDIFLVRAVGKHMKSDLERGNIPYKIVKGEKIPEIISNYLDQLKSPEKL